MSRARPAVFIALAALLATAHAASAQDDDHEWPPGSAMHAIQQEGKSLEAARVSLDQAHAGLLRELEREPPAGPSRLARAAATHLETWLAYSLADCELAGILTGAGTSWPLVHELGCKLEAVEERAEAVRSATACLQQLEPDLPDFDRIGCLHGLATRSMLPPD